MSDELRETRGHAAATMTEMLEREGGAEAFSADDLVTYTAAEADYDTLTSRIAAYDLTMRHEARNAPADDDDDETRSGGDGQADDGQGDAAVDTADYRDAFENYVRRGDRGINADERGLLEQRFQQVGTDSLGGFTVAPAFWNRISEAMKWYGDIRADANVITTTTGATLPWVTGDNTANEGEILASEGVEVSDEDVTFGTRNIGSYTFSSKAIKVSQQLLQDSGINMASYLGDRIGERLGRITNRMHVEGSGSGQPLGILTALVADGTRDVAAAGADSITYDDMIELEHGIDKAYRNERARFYFSDATLKTLRKLKDGDGRPLWQPSLTAGVASSFNGKPYTITSYMPELAADAAPIMYGNMRPAFVVRQVRGMTMVRLDELYARSLQVAFFAWCREDSAADDLRAMAVLKMAAA